MPTNPAPNYKLDIYGERVPVMVGVFVMFDGVRSPVGLLPRAEAVARFGGKAGFDFDGVPA